MNTVSSHIKSRYFKRTKFYRGKINGASFLSLAAVAKLRIAEEPAWCRATYCDQYDQTSTRIKYTTLFFYKNIFYKNI